MAGLVGAFLFSTQMNLEEVLRVDRFQHLVVSSGLFLFFYLIFSDLKGRMAWAFSATLAIGILKELFDHQMQGFDIYADVSGILLGILLLFAFKFMSQTPVSSR